MPVFKRTLSEFIFRRFMLKHYASNLLVDMNLEAKRETLAYIKAKMPDAPYFEKHPQLVRYVVDLVDRQGLFLEFGVGRGKSMRWIDQPPADAQRKANWARLIQKVYKVDPLECANCGATMRIIALIDDADVIERILRHLNVWEPPPDPVIPKGPDIRPGHTAKPCPSPITRSRTAPERLSERAVRPGDSPVARCRLFRHKLRPKKHWERPDSAAVAPKVDADRPAATIHGGFDTSRQLLTQ